VYAFAVFGYLTATIATFFIGKDRSDEQQEAQAARKAARSDAEALRAEITVLNARLDALLGQPAQAQGHNRQGGQGQSPDGARPATQTETRQPALG
ncbi:MAG TPA: hypothetical protein VFA70_13940, partial [Dehalococcoidia bacterium]|nr:hypothetical protein [Dehalococcoidia bacterium]